MARTDKRALVTGEITTIQALVFAAILSVFGFGLLALWVNLLTLVVGAVGVVSYVVIYGYAKRHSVHGTLIGSIAGSMPIVAGYTAVTGHFDRVALLLFLVMAFWQMPHFYAIGIYRLKDYKAAGLPIWPAKRGIESTKQWMVIFVVLYSLAVGMLGIVGHTGYSFTLIMLGLCLYWLSKCFKGYTQVKTVPWARSMFGYSLIVLLSFSILLGASPHLP